MNVSNTVEHDTDHESDFREIEVPWLRLGLEMLANAGSYYFNIDHLARNVGKAKTSFYHFFESKEKYFERLVHYWAYAGTQAIIEQVSGLEDPEQQLVRTISIIHEQRIEGLAWIQFKNLAVQQAEIGRVLERVEMERLVFVSRIFEGLGFEQEEAMRKARVFMYGYFGWLVLNWGLEHSVEEEKQEIVNLMEMLGLAQLDI